MSIEYIEINEKSFIPECVEIHKKIFHLSDAEAFPSLFFNMIIRKEHPLGIIIGCFRTENSKSELIGLTVTLADLEEKSLYCVLIGVLEEFQNGRHGYMFSQKLSEVALKRGLKKLYGIYDPLEANLGKLYAFIGGITTKYIQAPLTQSYGEIVVDKVLFEWPFINGSIKKNRQRKVNNSLEKITARYKVVETSESSEDEFLIEIPCNYLELKNNDVKRAHEWRVHTREILSHYLNNQGYVISDCFSSNINGYKRTFYLLTNKLKNERYSQLSFSDN